MKTHYWLPCDEDVNDRPTIGTRFWVMGVIPAMVIGSKHHAILITPLNATDLQEVLMQTSCKKEGC